MNSFHIFEKRSIRRERASLLRDSWPERLLRPYGCSLSPLTLRSLKERSKRVEGMTGTQDMQRHEQPVTAARGQKQRAERMTGTGKKNLPGALYCTSRPMARAHKKVDIIIIIRRKLYLIVIQRLTLYASGHYFIPQLSACQRDFTHRKRIHLGYWKSKMDPKLIEMGYLK